MTFRRPAEKCEFEPLFYENLVFAVQRGPRIAPNFDVFSEGRSGGSVWRSETPKMPTEADFGGFRADSGPPFGPIFGTFRHFLGGRNFDRKMIEIRDTFARGRRQGAGLRKLILSLQTPNHPFVSEGHRPSLHHAQHPEGVRRILRASPPAAGPLELFFFNRFFWAQEGLENYPEVQAVILAEFGPKRRHLDPIRVHLYDVWRPEF